MLSRRDLVGKLAVGTAAVCAVGSARSAFGSVRREAAEPTRNDGATAVTASSAVPPASQPPLVDTGVPATQAAQPPWDLLHPLAIGSTVGQGWRLAGLTGEVDGTCVVTLQNDRGRSHRVHICRNDGRPQGIVYTDHFDLLAMNGGEGDLPTDEHFAHAVGNLAHALARNEDRPQQRAVVAALMPHAERLRRFTGPEDRRLR